MSVRTALPWTAPERWLAVRQPLLAALLGVLPQCRRIRESSPARKPCWKAEGEVKANYQARLGSSGCADDVSNGLLTCSPICKRHSGVLGALCNPDVFALTGCI